MDSVLSDILSKRSVTNGVETVPLSSAIDAEEGNLIQRAIRDVKPQTYLEVGLAFGVSALYAGEALKSLSRSYRHIILDPKQHEQWKGIGLHNLRQAGLFESVEFHEEFSEYQLPKLTEAGTVIDMAFIDGWHTFDHTLIDFFYINRMLRVGGVIVFDDHHFPAVNRVVRYARKYPAYRLYDRTTPQWRSLNWMQVARRNYHLVRQGRMSFASSAVAIQKVEDDVRPWNWYRSF